MVLHAKKGFDLGQGPSELRQGAPQRSDDPLASLNLVEADYGWATAELCKIAAKHAKGRVVSALEGGYDLHALAASGAAHIRALMAA